jgi:DNA-binding MarR family transcriptional regulator
MTPALGIDHAVRAVRTSAGLPVSATPAGEDVAVRIMRLSEALARLARIRVTQTWGVSGTDKRILDVLDRKCGLAVSEVARRAHIDKAWISRLTRNLETKGLIERRTDAADSRLQLLTLTADGCRLVDDMQPSAEAAEKLLLRGIMAERFKRDLDCLLANADALLGSEAALMVAASGRSALRRGDLRGNPGR